LSSGQVKAEATGWDEAIAALDGANFRELLLLDPDGAMKLLEHDLFGIVSTMQGAAELLTEDLQQPEADSLANIESLRQIAGILLHESRWAQTYLVDLWTDEKVVE
jgi:hypothetical protein